jgi:cytidylate kinase
MYRAVTLAVLERGLAPEDGRACAAVARALALDFDAGGHVLLDGRPGEPAIRGPEVTRAVSLVAAHEGVRAAVVARQRAVAAAAGRDGRGGVVAEGRDTTTVVFPDATHKFYLSASVGERALRRARQENALARLPEIRGEIERRDRLDSEREHSPLRVSPDARRIETDGLSAEEVLARLLAEVREPRA